MKRIVGLLVVLGVGLMPLRAQTTRAIRQLEQQRNELKEQIAASETLLQSTKKDVKSQLADLALITGQIDERQKYLNTIESDVQTLRAMCRPFSRKWTVCRWNSRTWKQNWLTRKRSMSGR